MVDGVALLMAPFFMALRSGFFTDERGTNLLDSGAPFYDSYACADGRYVAVGALEPQFYAALVAGLGLDAASLGEQNDKANWPAMRRAVRRDVPDPHPGRVGRPLRRAGRLRRPGQHHRGDPRRPAPRRPGDGGRGRRCPPAGPGAALQRDARRGRPPRSRGRRAHRRAAGRAGLRAPTRSPPSAPRAPSPADRPVVWSYPRRHVRDRPARRDHDQDGRPDRRGRRRRPARPDPVHRDGRGRHGRPPARVGTQLRRRGRRARPTRAIRPPPGPATTRRPSSAPWRPRSWTGGAGTGWTGPPRWAGGEQPAEMVFNMTLMEYLTHGWDLAVGSGQDDPVHRGRGRPGAGACRGHAAARSTGVTACRSARSSRSRPPRRRSTAWPGSWAATRPPPPGR